MMENQNKIIRHCSECGHILPEAQIAKSLDFNFIAVKILDELEKDTYKTFQELIGALEDAAIRMALDEDKGIVAKAARKLKLNRTALSERIKRFKK